MADPKYAGLPGIASDQPDMYETEGDDQVEGDDDESGGETETNVLHLSSLGWLGDLEVGGVSESLVERYARLICEVAELEEELDGVAESQKETGSMAGLNLQVMGLRSQLENCQLEEQTGHQAVEQLTRDIQGIKAGQLGGEEEKKAVYQLYLSQMERPSVDLAVVDNRLAQLEKVVGLEVSSERKVLSAVTDCQSLTAAVDSLDSRRQFLKQQHIDHVEGRLAALNYKMNAIAEQKVAVGSATKDDKMTRLQSMIESQTSLASVLPELVTRLETVESLAASAGGWREVLDSTHKSQLNTDNLIQQTNKQLAESKNLLEGSLSGVAEKFADLQKQIKEISV